jgi:hypothetical protein
MDYHRIKNIEKEAITRNLRQFDETTEKHIRNGCSFI